MRYIIGHFGDVLPTPSQLLEWRKNGIETKSNLNKIALQATVEKTTRMQRKRNLMTRSSVVAEKPRQLHIIHKFILITNTS